MSKFLVCTDGSYIQVRHVTRLFVQDDVITNTAVVCASLPGPAHPMKLVICGEGEDETARQRAQRWLDLLISTLED